MGVKVFRHYNYCSTLSEVLYHCKSLLGVSNMVLKKSKFGGNTGNTLRRSENGGMKYCRTASFISKDTSPRRVLVDDRIPPNKEWMTNIITDKKNPHSLNGRGGVKI